MNSATAAKPAPEFIFRGNAMASGGYLTILDGKPVTLNEDVVTVHGESSLPGIGGVSHSVVPNPTQPFAPWITYGACETRVEGISSGGSARTILRATVQNVRIKTRPSPQDNVPGVQEIALQATSLALVVESLHPPDKQPQFYLPATPVVAGLSLQIKRMQDSNPITKVFELSFDQPLLNGYTMDRYEHQFQSDRKFFDQQAARFRAGCTPQFGEKPPRDAGGYVVTSIVNGFKLDGKFFPGSEHFEPGFGRISFGTLIADGYSRRLTLLRVRMGSDPAGASNHCGVDTNGVWN